MRWSLLLVVLAVGLAAPGCAVWSSSIPAGRTVSYGGTSSGFLLNGVPLPDRGEGYVRARPGDDTRWGTPQLVGVIERAAARVATEHPRTSALRVGDLSASHGGEHFRHRSHRTGRDADILFYQTDGRGTSLRATGFYRFDQEGRIATANADGASAVEPSPGSRGAPAGIRFDVARNWSLVAAMLEDPEANIQWIFVADGLKALLLEHAIRVRAQPETILRASYVLHQPRGAAPHDDHFHVRVACSVDDLTLGCEHQGPLWPWLRKALEKLPVLASASDEQLVAELAADELTAELVPYALVQSDQPPGAPEPWTAAAPIVAAAAEGELP